MASLVGVPTNYVNLSKYRADGGSIQFLNNIGYQSAKYIDTRFLDISAFAASPTDIVTFTLNVIFASGEVQTLWTDTTHDLEIGFTVPKKIIVLDYYESIVSFELIADSTTNNYYFMLWSNNNNSINISQLERPSVVLSTNSVIYSYDDTMFSPFLLSDVSYLTINNTVPIDLCGNITWSITPVNSGLSIVNQSNNSIDIQVDYAIYYNGQVTVTAINAEGTPFSAQFSLQLMSIPRISPPDNVYLTLPSAGTVSTNIGNVISSGTGPVTWSIISNYLSSQLYMQNSTLIANTFIDQQGVTLVVQNINGDTATVTFDVLIASDPGIHAPISIIANLDSANAYTYAGMYNTTQNTGPLTWYISTSSVPDGLSLSSNVLSIQPFCICNQFIQFSVSNLLGKASSKTTHITSSPSPVFTLSNTVSGSGAGNYSNIIQSIDEFTQYTYPIVLTYPVTNVTWTLVPSNVAGVSLVSNPDTSNTGASLILSTVNTFINSQVFTVNAKNLLGSSIQDAFHITSANTPYIVSPGSIEYVMFHDSFQYQMVTSNSLTSTGPLQWSIVPQLSGLSIDRYTGVIDVQQGTTIDTYVQVTTSNLCGGSNTVGFPIQVVQIPILNNPGPLTSNVDRYSSYTYQLTSSTLHAGFSWYLSNTSIPGLTINSNTGLLTLDSNYTVNNKNATVIASNIYNISCNLTSSVSFNMSIEQIPDFVCPSSIYDSFDATNMSYTYQFSALSQGIASWSVSSIPGFSITNSGLLTFMSNVHSYSGLVSVSASNSNGYVTTKQTSVDLLINPSIHASPTTIQYSIPTNGNFTYMIPNNYNDVYDDGSYPTSLHWSIVGSTPNGVYINNNTGILTFASNTQFMDYLTISAQNARGASNTVSIPFNVSQTPVLLNPQSLTYSLDNGTTFTYPLSQTAIGTGQLSYVISYYPGLSITNSGVITLDSGYSINQNNISVSTFNTTGGTSTINFSMNIGHTPILSAPANNTIIGSMTNQDFSYQFDQTAVAPGQLFASLFASGPNISPYMSFSNNGVLTVSQNSFVSNVGVVAQLSNISGGYCNQTFDVYVAQTPSFNISPTLYYMVQSNEGFMYTLSNTATGTGQIGWYLNPTLSNLSLTTPNAIVDGGTTSLLTFPSNTYINCNVTIAASNQFGGEFDHTVSVIIGEKPAITNVGLVSLSSNFNFNPSFGQMTYSYQLQSNVGTGPLTWNIVNAATSTGIPGLSVSSLGLITYTSSSALQKTVKASVVNIPQLGSYTCNVSFNMNITSTPMLYNPGTLSNSMGSSAYTYLMSNINSQGSGTTSWSITSAAPYSALGINSNTGLITFNTQNAINDYVNVSASNTNGAVSSISFHMNIAQTPSIIIPSSIVYNQQVGSYFSYDVLQTSSNTGALTWTVTDSNMHYISGLSISSTGLGSSNNGYLTYSGTSYVNTPVLVTAKNQLNASNVKLFNLLISHQPVISYPGSLLSSNLTSVQPYTYQMINSAANVSSKEPSIWSVSPSINGLSINSSTGLLTVASNAGINCNITVTASNLAGGYCNTTFPILVTTPPTIVGVSSVIQASVSSNTIYNYTMSNTEPRAEPLKWSLSPISISSCPGLSIDSNTGVLSLAASYALSNSVVVYASNVLNQYSSNTIFLDVLRTPSIINPGTITSNISFGGSNTVSFPVFQSTSNTGPLSWTISSTTPGVAISYTPGTSNYATVTAPYMSNLVTVTASNAVGGYNNATFLANISTYPSLSNFSVSSVSSNAVMLAWGGAFTSGINIYTASSSNSNINTNPYTYSNLIPNHAYTFTGVPVNTLAITGPSCNVSSVVTLPFIPGVLTSSNILSRSATVSWSNIRGYYDHAVLAWSNLSSYIGSNSSNYSVCNLLPNTVYNASLTPYNYSNVAGSSLNTSISTLAEVGVSISNITTSNAIASLYTTATNSYSNLQLQLSSASGTVLSNIFMDSNTPTQTLANLSANNAYTLTAIPYDNNGVIGTCNINTFYTLTSGIQPLSLTLNSYENYTLYWGAGNYTYVNVSWLTNGITTTQSNVTQSQLYVYLGTSSNNVTFTVTPYNQYNIAGPSRSIAVRTENSVAISFEPST
jgi:hypothetical protein